MQLLNAQLTVCVEHLYYLTFHKLKTRVDVCVRLTCCTCRNSARILVRSSKITVSCNLVIYLCTLFRLCTCCLASLCFLCCFSNRACFVICSPCSFRVASGHSPTGLFSSSGSSGDVPLNESSRHAVQHVCMDIDFDFQCNVRQTSPTSAASVKNHQRNL